MNYPHGLIELNSLRDMVNSREYVVFFEENGSQTQITNRTELSEAIRKELEGKGTICYELSNFYFDKHPDCGEEKLTVDTVYNWEWKSFETNKCYAIKEDLEDHSIELVHYNNDFNDSCFVIAYWSMGKNGIEFHDVGGRLFNEIDEKDVPTIWKAIKNAWNYINGKV